ncbi:MAG: hypothetical protein P4L40_21680 [Terracidiphilus sp.]|nr:hypothetical protein [Terracidiphilus sp.]
MSTTKDDLEAVRTVVEAIKDFKQDEQQRIFRWVAEKLGLPQPFTLTPHLPTVAQALPAEPGGATAPRHPSQTSTGGAVDIKTFFVTKKPRNDVQFAAAVAYYYRFESPQAERKDAIDQEVLQDATRMVGRERFVHPLTTLNNAHRLGLLDRGPEKGTFTINTVGENLVAMTLPDGATNAKPTKKHVAKKAAKRRPAKTAKKA